MPELLDPTVNSARVAGGTPLPVHFKAPPQSPVTQVPRPEESKLQPVRAQKRPDHPGGALSCMEAPGLKGNPPSPRVLVLPERIPGHTV